MGSRINMDTANESDGGVVPLRAIRKMDLFVRWDFVEIVWDFVEIFHKKYRFAQ